MAEDGTYPGTGPERRQALRDPDGLICPASQIIDIDAIFSLLRTQADGGADGDSLRKTLLTALRTAQKTGRESIAEAFRADPHNSRATTRAYTYLTDQLVRAALHFATRYKHPTAHQTNAERLAVMAVGGYGRGEMAPFSDVDLLFLTPYKITPWAESVIETMLYLLWDLKLKVGHASRTIKDCIRLGREDFTIRTAMLEHRFLAGDAALADEFDRRLKDELYKGSAREFIEAKLAERDTRHRKFFQRYVVEPNVKEGKGGLRDLQSLFWIGKYVHGVQDAADLVPLGVFRPSEFESFIKA